MNNQQSDDLVQSFIAEGFELLDDTEVRLNNLEGDCNQEIINTIFRMFHSIKGAAGFLDFNNIKDVSHEAETLLSIYRDSSVVPGRSEIDLLYQTCDFLRQMLGAIEQHLSDADFASDAGVIINSIKQSITNLKGETQPPRQSPEKPSERTAASPELITPEIVEKFAEETNDLLDECEIFVMGLEKAEDAADLVARIYRHIHSIKGNAGFLNAGEPERICMDIEFFLDGLRNHTVEINTHISTYLLQQIDALRKSLDQDMKTIDTRDPRDKKLGEILIDLGEIEEADLTSAMARPGKRTGEALVETGKIDQQTLDKALSIQNRLRDEITQSHSLTRRRDIRVSMDKLDHLFELVGELITAQSMVLHHPAVRAITAAGFASTMNYLEKITRDIHETTLSVRMVPLEGLFNKMYRLVRDLSAKSGKSVQLLIGGANTEMDKNVIDEIADPLIHIVRNAVDHGLETASERGAAGKEETGHIHITARHMGGDIWLSIRDDGRGLDRDAILAKAVEKGLIQDASSELTDREIWKLIMQPGFSTAREITNISGRGVGMDVVNRNIAKLNGTIDLNSLPGQGTEILLKIPLTMAIIDAIIVRSGESLFAIPTLDIAEFFKTRSEQVVNPVPGDYLISLREDVLPVMKLKDIFHMQDGVEDFTRGTTVVVQKDGRKLCLLTDEICGSQQIVVKPLDESLENINGVSGCSIMFSGEVVLIIDTQEVINSCVA